MRALIFVSMLALATAVQADGIKEGQWEFSNTMRSPGMPDMSEIAKNLPPGMKLPGGMEMGGGAGGVTMKVKQCVTNDQPTPAASDQGKMKCETIKQKRNGGRIEWAQHCTGENSDITSEGVATYSGDSMTSEFTSKGTMDGNPTEMAMSTTGRYLGPCPAK